MSKQTDLINVTDAITVSGGNVGINTSSPDTALNIGFSGADQSNSLRIEGSNGSSEKYALDIEADGENAKTYFKVGVGGGVPTTRMTIDSSGSVLVGKTSATDAGVGIWLDAPNGRGFFTASNDYCAQFRRLGNTGVAVYFLTDETIVGTISLTGSSTSYNTSSDYRLKTDAQPMTGASARVQALNPVNFEWLSDGTRVDGFLAHEAQEIVPEAVTGTKDAMRDEEYEVTPAVLDDDGNVVTEAVMGTRSVPEYQGIDQSKLVPLLTAALQEALTEISDLKARVTALEAV